MKEQYRARTTFMSPRFGYVEAGQILDVERGLALQMMQYQMLEKLEIDPVKKLPVEMPTGVLLPAGLALLNGNAITSDSDMKQGNAKLSPSTAATSEQNSLTSSMPAMTNGGENTTPKRRGRPAKSAAQQKPGASTA